MFLEFDFHENPIYLDRRIIVFLTPNFVMTFNFHNINNINPHDQQFNFYRIKFRFQTLFCVSAIHTLTP